MLPAKQENFEALRRSGIASLMTRDEAIQIIGGVLPANLETHERLMRSAASLGDGPAMVALARVVDEVYERETGHEPPPIEITANVTFARESLEAGVPELRREIEARLAIANKSNTRPGGGALVE